MIVLAVLLAFIVLVVKQNKPHTGIGNQDHPQRIVTTSTSSRHKAQQLKHHEFSAMQHPSFHGLLSSSSYGQYYLYSPSVCATSQLLSDFCVCLLSCCCNSTGDGGDIALCVLFLFLPRKEKEGRRGIGLRLSFMVVRAVHISKMTAFRPSCSRKINERGQNNTTISMNRSTRERYVLPIPRCS